MLNVSEAEGVPVIVEVLVALVVIVEVELGVKLVVCETDCVNVCVCDADWLCDTDEQTIRSAAMAAAESAELKMRAFDNVPCHTSKPTPPFQPIYTTGFTGVFSAVSVQF